MVELDDLIDEVGGFGLYQIVLVMVMLIPLSLTAANMIASVFEAMIPDVRCRSPYEDYVKSICPKDFQMYLLPEENDMLSTCHRFNFTDFDASVSIGNSTTNCSLWFDQQSADIVKCSSWEYDTSVMKNTIVTDFHLVCGDKWAAYIAQSALMLGVAAGNMLAGFMSDRIGRRNAFLFSSIGATVLGTGLSFTQTYTSFCIVRVLLGFFIYCPFPVIFVWCSELTTPKYRPVVAQILEASFPIGYMLLALIVFFLREWRKIQLAISVPYALGILIWWFMTESPRWLHQKNRPDDMRKVLEKIAKVNKSRTPDIDVTKARARINLVENQEKVVVVNNTTNTHSDESYFKTLTERPHTRRASLIMFFNWFVVSCAYFGITMNGAELVGDLFRNICIMAAAELVAVIVVIPLLNYVGRIPIGCLSEIISGFSCFIMVSAPSAGVLVSLLLGKISISMSFSVIYVYTTEIYPTSIRNLGVCACSLFARFGGVMSPIIALSGSSSRELPYIIFGALSLVAGISLLMLPDTKNSKLSQTVDEGESFLAQRAGIFSKCSKTK